jgi:hypothetical protein
MPRDLKPETIAALMGQETDEVFLALITIADGEDNETVLFRLVNNTRDLNSRGNLFTAYPFQVTMPSEDGETISRVLLTIDNVDQALVSTIRNLVIPPSVTLEIVLASDSDVVEAGPWKYQLNSVRYDDMKITADMGFESILQERWPQHAMTPQLFPGLFNAT